MWHDVCNTVNTLFNKYKIVMKQDQKKYVRVTAVKNNKYVEFDFAINHQEFFVELVLPLDMFDTFCKKNNVIFLEPEEESESEVEKLVWRISHARS